MIELGLIVALIVIMLLALVAWSMEREGICWLLNAIGLTLGASYSLAGNGNILLSLWGLLLMLVGLVGQWIRNKRLSNIAGGKRFVILDDRYIEIGGDGIFRDADGSECELTNEEIEIIIGHGYVEEIKQYQNEIKVPNTSETDVKRKIILD